MEPVTTAIVAALVAGATAALKDVATDAIKDAYAGLRRIISDKYDKVGPFAEAVADDPASEDEQRVLAKKLDQAGAAQDEELKKQAVALLDAVEALKEQPRAAALFDFGKLRAAKNFELEDIDVVGTALRADEATFEGDFKAKGMRQTGGGTPPKH